MAWIARRNTPAPLLQLLILFWTFLPVSTSQVPFHRSLGEKSTLECAKGCIVEAVVSGLEHCTTSNRLLSTTLLNSCLCRLDQRVLIEQLILQCVETTCQSDSEVPSLLKNCKERRAQMGAFLSPTFSKSRLNPFSQASPSIFPCALVSSSPSNVNVLKPYPNQAQLSRLERPGQREPPSRKL